MPADPRVFEDPDFRAMPRDDQITLLGEMDPDFASLERADQEALLGEFVGSPGGGFVEGVKQEAGAFRADPAAYVESRGKAAREGLVRGAAGVVNTAANLADLWTKLPGGPPGLAETVQGARDVAGGLVEQADTARARRARDMAGVAGPGERVAETVGEMLPGFAPAVGAAKLAGPVLGFGLYSAAGAADQGPAAALEEGAKGALLGRAFGIKAPLPRAATVAGGTYLLSPEGDPVKLGTEVLTMGGLAAMTGRLGPREVRAGLEELGKVGREARIEPEPVAAAETPLVQEPQPSRARRAYSLVSEGLLKRFPSLARAGEGEAFAAERPISEVERAQLRVGAPTQPEPTPFGEQAAALRRAETPTVDRVAEAIRQEVTQPVAGEAPRVEDAVDGTRSGGYEDPGAAGLREGVREARAVPAGGRGARGGEAEPLDGEAARARASRVREELEAARGGVAPEAGGDGAYLSATGVRLAGPGPLYTKPRDVAITAPDAPLPKRIVNVHKAIEDFARAANVPIQRGSLRPHFKGKKAKGVLGYAESTRGPASRNTVRVKQWGDIQTATHEVAHVLDAVNPAVKAWYDWAATKRAGGRITQAQAEVASVSYDIAQPWEGFAEFVRLWTTQPKEAAMKVPTAVAEFEGRILPLLPKKVQKALWRVRDQGTKYFEQGGEAAMESVFGPMGESGAVSTRADRYAQMMLDDMHGRLMAERIVLGEANAGRPDGIWARGKQLRSIPDLVNGLMTKGYPVWRGRPGGDIGYEGRGLQDILAPVYTSKRAAAQMDKYMVARQAAIAKQHGVETPLTDGMIAQGMKFETPARKAAYEELAHFRERVADFAQEAGLFSAEQRANWRFGGEMAFSMYREMGAAARGEPIADPLDQSAGVFRMRGSTRNLRDPVDSLMTGPGRLIQLALENLDKRAVAELLKGPNGGKLGQELPADHRLVRVSREALTDALVADLRRNGVRVKSGKLKALLRSGMSEFLSLHAGYQRPHGNRVMTYLVDGKPKYVELFDPVLAQTIEFQRRPVQDVLTRWFLASPRRLYQTVRTAFPGFWVAQMARDPVTKMIRSKTALRSIKSAMQGSAFRGYLESLRGNPELAEMQANLGGVSIGASIPRSAGERRAQIIRHSRFEHGDPRAIFDLMNPGNWFRALDWIGKRLEAGPRLAESLRAKAQGMSARERAALYRDVTTDFAVQGSGKPVSEYPSGPEGLAAGATKFLLNFVPFYRAMMASNTGLARDMTLPENRAAVRTRFALLAGMGGAYYLWARQQPWWKEIDETTRRQYYVFPPMDIPGFGRVHPKLPKMQEVGFIVNLLEHTLEDILQRAEGGDPDAMKLAKQVTDDFMLNFGLGLGPVALIPYEQATNRYWHGDYPLVSEGEEGLLPYYQRGPGVPKTLEGVAWLTKDLPKEFQLSAPRLNEVTKTLLGSFGSFGLYLSDRALYPDTMPAPHPNDWPVVSRLLQREGQYTDTPREFYDLVEELERTRSTFLESAKRGDPETFRSYLGRPEIPAAKAIGKYKRAAEKITSEIKRVQDAKGLGPEQKRKRLDDLRKRRESYQKQGLTEARRILDAGRRR